MDHLESLIYETKSTKLSSGQHDLCLLSLVNLNVSCGNHKRENQRALNLFLHLYAIAEAMVCHGNAQ